MLGGVSLLLSVHWHFWRMEGWMEVIGLAWDSLGVLIFCTPTKYILNMKKRMSSVRNIPGMAFSTRSGTIFKTDVGNVIQACADWLWQ